MVDVVACGSVVGATEDAGAEVDELEVSDGEVDVELDDVVVRSVEVVVVAFGLVGVVRGSVRGVVTFDVPSTGCDGTAAGRTRMYSTSVATKTNVTTAVERRTRARLTVAAP